MNRMHPTFFVTLLFLLAPTLSVPQETTHEHEVRAAVSVFARAFQEAEVSVLRTLLTENYLHVNGGSGSVLNRDQWLTWLTSRRVEIDRGDFAYETYQIEDLQVQVYGEVAVVVGVTRAHGRRNGVSFTKAGYFTNVWVKQNGVWRRAGFHDSPIPEFVP